MLTVGTQFHQQLTGINVIMIYAVNIFASIGIPKFKGMIAIGVVNVLSTLVAMKKIDSFGRKQLLLVGAACQVREKTTPPSFLSLSLPLLSLSLFPLAFEMPSKRGGGSFCPSST